MVWEQEASLVIMLTTTVERGRVSWTIFYRSCPKPEEWIDMDKLVSRNLVAALTHN